MSPLKNQFNQFKYQEEPQSSLDLKDILPVKIEDEQDLLFTKSKLKKDYHNHDGVNSNRIDFTDLIGFVDTVTSTTQITASKPRFASEQIKIYLNNATPGGTITTKRIYIYSHKAQRWFYFDLT